MCVMKNVNKHGFTLAELLIVVAIIAVLVAISIPIFTAQLDKARAAADAANVRAAKAAATTDYLTDHNDGTAVTYYYDAENGRISTDSAAAAAFKGYGKSDSDIKTDNAEGIPNNGTAGIVSIIIDSDGTVARWISSGGGTSGNNGLLGKLSASLTWNDIKSRITSESGYSLLPGTLVSDGNRLFLVFGNQNWYSNKKAASMADIVAAYPQFIEEITGSTSLLPDATVSGDRTSDVTIPAGAIAYYKEKYYCAREKITYNKWEDEKNPVTDSRWAQIK